MSDGAPGAGEIDAEPAIREAPTEEITYAGGLATSETVERVERLMGARPGVSTAPLSLQRMIAEIHARGKSRPRRQTRTAQSAL